MSGLPPLGPLQQAGLEAPPPQAAPVPMPASLPGQPGGVDFGAKIAELYGRMEGEFPTQRGAADKGLSDYMSALQGYAPDPSEKWLAFAKGITAPTKFGTLGEVIGNISGGLEPIIAKENALKNQYKMLAAQTGYQANEKNADQLRSGMLDLLKAGAQMQQRTGVQSAQAANALMRQVTTLYTQQLEGARKQAEAMTNVSEDDRNRWINETAKNNTVKAIDTIFTPEQVQAILPNLGALLNGGAGAHGGFGLVAPRNPAQPSAASPVPAQPTPPVQASQPPATPEPGGYNLDQQTSQIADAMQTLQAQKKRLEAAGDFDGARQASKQWQYYRDYLMRVPAINNAAERPAYTGTMPTPNPAEAPMGAPAATTIAERKAQSKGQEAQAKTVGEVAGKRQATQPEATSALAEYLDETQNTQRIVQEALKSPGLQKATGVAGMIPFSGNWLTAGGSDSADFIAKTKALSAQLGMLQMQAMKAASATGSTGLGAVTEAEHKLLQQQIDTLDLSQKPEKVQAALQNIQDRIDKMRSRIVEAYGRKYPDQVRQVKGNTYVQNKEGLWQPL